VIREPAKHRTSQDALENEDFREKQPGVSPEYRSAVLFLCGSGTSDLTM
jgi:hypothetical protein